MAYCGWYMLLYIESRRSCDVSAALALNIIGPFVSKHSPSLERELFLPPGRLRIKSRDSTYSWYCTEVLVQ